MSTLLDADLLWPTVVEMLAGFMLGASSALVLAGTILTCI